MSDWILFAVLGGLSLAAVRMYKRVPPDRCLVFFSKGPKPAVERIKLNGLAFVPPWRTVKTLYLGAVTFTIDGAEIGVRLDQPLRFLVGAENDWRRMIEAAERLAGLDAPALTLLAHNTIVTLLAGARMEKPDPAERLRKENSLTEDIRSALAAKGFRLLSCNLDGLFGDAPARFS